MSGLREVWGWRDTRTGQRVGVMSCPSRDAAVRQLEEWRERDRRGGRPDLHDLIPFVEVYEVDRASPFTSATPEPSTCHDDTEQELQEATTCPICKRQLEGAGDE